jgi:hypothetical protein
MKLTLTIAYFLDILFSFDHVLFVANQHNYHTCLLH